MPCRPTNETVSYSFVDSARLENTSTAKIHSDDYIFLNTAFTSIDTDIKTYERLPTNQIDQPQLETRVRSEDSIDPGESVTVIKTRIATPRGRLGITVTTITWRITISSKQQKQRFSLISPQSPDQTPAPNQEGPSTPEERGAHNHDGGHANLRLHQGSKRAKRGGQESHSVSLLEQQHD